MKRVLIGIFVGLGIGFFLGFVFGGRNGGYARFFESRVGFRLTNLSGKEVFVTSFHTNQGFSIAAGKSALIPHAEGGVRIEQNGAATWTYGNLIPMDLARTPYLITQHYHIPFGGGSCTATLALARDGRLFAARPDAEEVELSGAEQPLGFPITPLSDAVPNNRASTAEPDGD